MNLLVMRICNSLMRQVALSPPNVFSETPIWSCRQVSGKNQQTKKEWNNPRGGTRLSFKEMNSGHAPF